MSNVIQLKRSSTPAVSPSTGDLTLGEVAINTFDGEAYFKKDDGSASIIKFVNFQHVDTDSTFTANSDGKVPSQKAVKTALDTKQDARTITGTTNQLSVTNGDGVSGNPVVAIADNPIIPGTGSMTLPTGSTAERDTPTNGQLRFNNNSMELEVSRFNKYIPVGKVVQFFVGDIIQTTGTTILPYDATQPTITEGFQIWGQNITPLYNGSTIVVIYSIFTECGGATRSMATALYVDSNAIAVNLGYTGASSFPTCLSITKSFQTTDIIPIAITARAGPSAASTLYVNRGNTETMGGLTSTNYIIMEII